MMPDQAPHPHPELERLRVAIFDWPLDGIRKTGEAYALGAFLLTGAMIDVLAGLYFNPKNDRDGRQGERYAGFVERYFPPAYRRLELGRKLWRGLRCLPLHNFSAEGVLLLHGQDHVNPHLVEYQGQVVLRWENFLEDYEESLSAYWSALLTDPAIEQSALERCERYPPFTILQVPMPLALPVTLPASFAAATAYAGPSGLPGGGQPSEGIAMASGAVGPMPRPTDASVDSRIDEEKPSGGRG